MGGNKGKDSKRRQPSSGVESNNTAWVEPNYKDEEWFKRESCKCQYCDKTFDTPAAASMCITGHKRLRCYFCFATVKNTEDLFSHFTARHNKGGKETSIICPYCEASTPYRSVSCHVISIHMTNCAKASGDKGKSGSVSKKASNSNAKKNVDSDSEDESEDEDEESEASFTESENEKENVKTRAKRPVKRAPPSSEESEESEGSEPESEPVKKMKNGGQENKKKDNRKKSDSASESEHDEEDSDDPSAKKGRNAKKQKTNTESSTEEVDISSGDDSSDYELVTIKGKRNGRKPQAKAVGAAKGRPKRVGATVTPKRR